VIAKEMERMKKRKSYGWVNVVKYR
jgi:hypothetical protein